MNEKFSVGPKFETLDELMNFMHEKGFLIVPDGYDSSYITNLLFGGSEIKLIPYKQDKQEDKND